MITFLVDTGLLFAAGVAALAAFIVFDVLMERRRQRDHSTYAERLLVAEVEKFLRSQRSDWTWT